MLWTVIGVSLALLVVVGSLAAWVGSRLPLEHVATVKVRFAAKPEAVWAILDDPLSASSWRKDVKKTEKLPDLNGHASWREVTGFGAIVYELTESTPGISRTTRIVNDDLPFGGQWEHRLAPAGAGTEVTITERGFIKPPFFRFMAHYLFGYTSTMQGLLTELGARLGEKVKPEVVASGK